MEQYNSTGVTIISHPQTYLLVKKNEGTFQKSETRFFRQTCEEMKAALIVFFRLFLVGVEINEWKQLVLQKPPHFLSAFKFFTF